MTHVTIVGGGLSGLALARACLDAGRSVHVLEGRDRPGGRILSVDGLDLGPAWIWPGQPRIAALLDRLGLIPFEQYSHGHLLVEGPDGTVQRGRGPGGMEGALRVPGGLAAVTDALAATLPPGVLRTGCRVTGIAAAADGVRLDTSDGPLDAGCVVLALPPRLAADLPAPDLIDDAARAALSAVPTWMAGHAKAVAAYDRPFWRDAGLSGDAFSRRGPMVEMHDASAPGGPAALFGFLGVPPAARRDRAALDGAIRAQLARLFGPDAAEPRALHVRDWALDEFTATAADHDPPPGHPRYGPLPDPIPGRLLLAGTEMAPTHGGLVEGALEAAEAAFARLPD